MAGTAVGDTSASALCLGLLLEREDTVQGVERRLRRQFASAHFTRGTASKSLPRLAEAGYAELVERGAKASLDRYRVTPPGEAYFLEWLRQIELPPMVRDALNCKLMFFDITDVESLIEAVHDQEEAFIAAASLAHDDLAKERRARRRLDASEIDWRLELRMIKRKDAANLANAMAERLEALRANLEELLQAYREQP